MPLPKLSDEQRGLVDHNHGHLFAEACPGAGKTRAIVARYLRRTEDESRKGVALLSFTNAAIDEVRSRCGGRPDVLKAPHFVGTFDGFINRFISRPLYVRYYDKTPRFIESWQDTKYGRFRFDDMAGLPDFELHWFLFEFVEGQLRATLKDEWVDQRSGRLLTQYVTANRTSIERRADLRCRSLVRSGLVSCSASRAMATGLLARPAYAERFGQLLADRFNEVIIDEAQDCGPEELFILNLLKQHGVTMIAVADLDQSIFAFRRADPDGVRSFTRDLGTPLALNGNWRSSPAICSLNNSLRNEGRDETACGENSSCQLPVLLLEYKKQDEVAPAVDALLALHKRSKSEVIFLAHKERDAQRSAGVRGDRDSLGSNAVLGIAWAHTILCSVSSTSADRLRAVRLVERALRSAANVDDEDGTTLDERWLRDAAHRLAASLDPAGSAAKGYAQKVRDHVKNVSWPTSVTPKDKAGLGSFLKAPQESTWPTFGKDASVAFRFGTIHSVKGREFPTVVVVLPKGLREGETDGYVLDHWGQGVGSEARRVLYVGASRAQTLLILAVHTDHANRVAGLLKRDGVNYDLVS